MSDVVRPSHLHPGNQAEALGAALNQLGFTATVLKTRGHQKHPCVVVESGRTRQLQVTEYIYAAPDDGGHWWFWWSSLEQIAPLRDISVTADTIVRVLARFRGIYIQTG
jgi:hypothetical protein